MRFETANAGRHRCFRHDGDEADIAGAVHMRAAAKLDRERLVAVGLAHGHDAHLVAVFLAEQRARAGFDGLLDAHELGDDRLVLQKDPVGDILDARELLVADGLRMAEVEAQAIGRDERALLRHVIAEDLAQASCRRCVAEWLARMAERRS